MKLKLEQLEKDGIIAKVNKPTEWLNPLVIVEKKNNDLRLCLDPKFLNEAISREHFLIPTVNEIASTLSNKHWEPGQIVRRHERPRSFVVKTEKGEIVRRNRVDLRVSQNDFVVNNDHDLSETREESPSPVEDNCPKSSPEPTNPNTNENYVTRSGRAVKPIQKLNL